MYSRDIYKLAEAIRCTQERAAPAAKVDNDSIVRQHDVRLMPARHESSGQITKAVLIATCYSNLRLVTVHSAETTRKATLDFRKW
jgi:hypothetical protein